MLLSQVYIKENRLSQQWEQANDLQKGELRLKFEELELLKIKETKQTRTTMSNGLKKIEDKFNFNKVWLVKKYKDGSYYINQLNGDNVLNEKYQRISNEKLLEMGIDYEKGIMEVVAIEVEEVVNEKVAVVEEVVNEKAVVEKVEAIEVKEVEKKEVAVVNIIRTKRNIELKYAIQNIKQIKDIQVHTVSFFDGDEEENHRLTIHVYVKTENEFECITIIKNIADSKQGLKAISKLSKKVLKYLKSNFSSIIHDEVQHIIV